MQTLIVPFGVVAVLASILLPVPPAVLDFLLVANLLLALLLLLSTLYISEPLRLSALPTILLLATIYRLGLNVATTRLILTDANAGEVVHLFGAVVARGNLMVGVVVFLVITLVQFIVIAKGSERVAEVAARFTLDALPGKQMSIDADVRAGLLDMSAAREKRQELQTESRFYGALDGAMKFVKGDAIAGVVIVAVNIIGGLISGVMQHGLTISHALSKYTILTIGDGLVTQVPSLLNSLAAGMVVTRVVRGDGVPLAVELVAQLRQQRSVTIALGVFALVLSTLSGLPSFPLICLGALLCSTAMVVPKGAGRAAPQGLSTFVPKAPSVLGVELPPDQLAQLLKGGLARRIEQFRKRVFEETGVIMAAPDFCAGAGRTSHIKIRGVKVLGLALDPNEPEFEKKLWDSILAFSLGHAEEFVDDVLTRRTLDNFDQQAPELVSCVVPGLISVTQLTEILRSLVRDRISIANFDLILQAVAEATPRVSGERMILEQVRIALRRSISAKHLNTDGFLQAYALDVVLDLSLSNAERSNQQLDYALQQKIIEVVAHSEAALIVSSRAARRILSETLRAASLCVAVIAFDEVSPGTRLEIMGTIRLSDREAQVSLEEQLAA